MGMTCEQFWEESPYLVIAFRKAYRLKREVENEQAWLQGMYVCHAFSVVMSNAFAKKGAKRETYMEKPINIYPLTEQQKKQKEQEEMKKMQQAMEAMIRKQRSEKKPKGD